MNARGVNALAGVIHAAMKNCQTAAGIAMAVDAAGLLMSPETAAELARLRASATGAHQRIKEVLDYLATKDAVQLSEDAGVMGFHIVAVLDGPGTTASERAEQRAKAEKQQADYAEAVATVARLEQKRVELERIANAERARAAELEQQLATARGTVADTEDAPYRSSPLPPRDAICAGDDCGHNGAEHHHGDTTCWAHLPRLREADGTWSGIRICPCAAFVSGGAV